MLTTSVFLCPLCANGFVVCLGMERNKSTDLLAIRRWYDDDEIALTEHQEEKKRRFLVISSLMSKGKPNYHIIKILKKDFGISVAQCYRDIKDSIALYGDLRKAEKEGMRWILFDMMMSTRNKAFKAEDYRAAAAVESNMMKMIGADRDDPEMPDFEKLAASLNVVVVDIAAQQQMKELLHAGPVDLDALQSKKQITEDVEHEEIDSTGAAGEGD